MTKNILQLDCYKARDFFLKEESYSTLKFPPYIKFNSLIGEISTELEKSKGIYKKDKNIYPSRYENVNYQLFTNKDGKYAWRLLQLIHPVLYVDLVHKITEENNWDEILSAFSDFQDNTRIVCASLPIVSSADNDTKEQVAAWSKQVEQKSIELGLKYDYIFHTDIVDCYGAIYTHSIPWAIHTKEFAKQNRKKGIGNIIDIALRGMNYSQTNGIPQGSILMDFIAEMVLGYIDECLSNCLDDDMNYHIIRYRDDYRIFTNSKKDGDMIIRELSKILSELGMRLNGEKTIFSDDVVNSSIKSDKLHQIINNYQKQKDIKKQLLVIKNLADNYPNSGALVVALNSFDKDLGCKIRNRRIKRCKFFITQTPKVREEFEENCSTLVSILVSIALKNPRIYPVFSSILSTIICNLTDEKKKDIIKLVVKKFKNKPNSEYLFLWLQRIAITAKIDIEHNTKLKLFKLVEKQNNNISRLFSPINYDHLLWNSKDWLADDFCEILKINNKIVDGEEIDKLSCIIDNKEVNSFHYY